MSYMDKIAFTSLVSAMKEGYVLSTRFSVVNGEPFFRAVEMLGNNNFCIVDCANEGNCGFRYALVKKDNLTAQEYNVFWHYYQRAAKRFMSERTKEEKVSAVLIKRKERQSVANMRQNSTLDSCILLQRFREGEYNAFAKAVLIAGRGKFQIIDCLRMENFGFRFALVCEKYTNEAHIREFYETVVLYRGF